MSEARKCAYCEEPIDPPARAGVGPVYCTSVCMSAAFTEAEGRMFPRWRTGKKLERTLYLDEQVVGMVDTPKLASAIVAAMNGADAQDPTSNRDAIGYLVGLAKIDANGGELDLIEKCEEYLRAMLRHSDPEKP